MQNMIEEMNRCLGCKVPRCQKGCPLNQDIRDFIQAAKTDLIKAREIIDNKSMLSSFCSIVCPHDLQCEGSCILGIKKTPVNIGAIEQYIVRNTESKRVFEQFNKKVLVIGSGPAGISFSYLALKHGMKVDVYEKEKQLGGVPIYGIPNFRYDKNSYLKYIDFVKENANISYSKSLGENFKLNDIVNDYDYIYVACGSDNPNILKIEGKDLENIIMSRDFLTQYNSKGIDLTGKDVIVIGAGNVSMDAARCAIRSNAKSSTVVYRRTLAESTASKHEIDGAVEDDVIFKFLSSPNKFVGEKEVSGLIVEKMQLVEKEGERPYPVGTNEFETLKADYVIIAIGQKLPSELKNDESLEFDEWSNLLSREINNKVFFGGDMINGPSSVARALNDSNDVMNKIIMDIKK